MSRPSTWRSSPPSDRLIIEPWIHTAYDGIPYFDEALQVPQSYPHELLVTETMPILRAIGTEAGLRVISDHPIWYIHPETLEQRAYHGDCVFVRPGDIDRVTANDLLLVIEVVSTNDSRKESKDIHFQRYLNEFNRVPEFGLIFPDLADARSVTWFRLEGEQYERHELAPGGRVVSRSIPELELRVLPRDQWTEGDKLDIWYRGKQRPRLAVERARAEQETARAEQEAARAEQEAARAEQEAARAERLAQRLRELGVDPEA